MIPTDCKNIRALLKCIYLQPLHPAPLSSHFQRGGNGREGTMYIMSTTDNGAQLSPETQIGFAVRRVASVRKTSAQWWICITYVQVYAAILPHKQNLDINRSYVMALGRCLRYNNTTESAARGATTTTHTAPLSPQIYTSHQTSHQTPSEPQTRYDVSGSSVKTIGCIPRAQPAAQ